jgi:hypothetical protein
MKQSPARITPALAEVQSRFHAWRQKRKHRSPIPEELWTAAVLLTQEHSLNKISKTLHLSYTTLKERVELSKRTSAVSSNPSLDFIPIDIHSIHSAECIVEMEHRNGNKMRMHFKGEAELDLQFFAESFWRASV